MNTDNILEQVKRVAEARKLMADGPYEVCTIGFEGDRMVLVARCCNTDVFRPQDTSDRISYPGVEAAFIALAANLDWQALAAELAGLRAVVERLPKTKDGAVILPGMTLWDLNGDKYEVAEIGVDHINGPAVYEKYGKLDYIGKVFSTAALAAQEPKR